ncbi:MAG TPA: hypothetical protein VIU61_10385 [Kofleriaceae bacterium]
MTRVLISLLAACGSGEATPPAEVAPASAPVLPASPEDAMPIQIPIEPTPEDPSPNGLNSELEKALRTTGAVIQHIEGHVTVIEDDLPARTVSRQRASGIAAIVARLLVDPVREPPRCFRRGTAVVCSQIRRGSMTVPGSDHRPIFLIYCHGTSWRLTLIMLGFSGVAARDVFRDPQQSACP